MANTFNKIESITVGSTSVSSITFSSIPSTYTDLVLKCSTRTDRGGGNEAYIQIRFNGATTGWSVRRLEGSGSTGYTSTESNNWAFMAPGASQTASTFGNTDIYIPNYATSGSYNKSFSVDSIEETNATTAYMQMTAGMWSNTAAINSITILVNSDNSANFIQYSTFTLYGINNS